MLGGGTAQADGVCSDWAMRREGRPTAELLPSHWESGGGLRVGVGYGDGDGAAGVGVGWIELAMCGAATCPEQAESLFTHTSFVPSSLVVQNHRALTLEDRDKVGIGGVWGRDPSRVHGFDLRCV